MIGTSQKKIVTSFDLTYECCDFPVGRGVLEYVEDLSTNNTNPSIIEVDRRNIATSWPNLRSFLQRNDLYSLVVTYKPTTNSSVLYDVLLARNDIEVSRLLYNMDALIADFKALASSAGNALDYFDIKPRDAAKIIWSHNTDTWEQINNATTGISVYTHLRKHTQSEINI